MATLGAGDAALAAEFSLPRDLAADILLERSEGRLQLRDTRNGAPGPLYADFDSPDIRRRVAAGRSLPLARAVDARPLRTVLDATAGLGRDACVLTRLGCRVTAIEKSPVIAALLRDGLQRAGIEIDLLVGDAVTLMRQLKERPEVVYLDPMFPPRRKSALVKKEMQYFHGLLDEEDTEQLLATARATATERVVIKRPTHTPETTKPNHTHKGKTVRFDVYVA